MNATGEGEVRRVDADFAEFVATRSDALGRTAYLLTGDNARAEDLLQTVLVRVYRRWPHLDHTTSPDAYTRRALVNTWLSWRSRLLDRETLASNVPDSAAPGDAIDAAATRLDVVAALRLLPPRQRATVVLRYYEDLTEVETAAVLGCSVGTVKSQTARAMAVLRRALEQTDSYKPSKGERRG